MGKLIDLTGQRFGMWEVLEKGTVKKTNSGSIIYWKCRCQCGTEKEVRGSDLKNGKSTTCGCSRKEGPKDLTNMRFGRLVVIEQAGKDSHKNCQWRCKCDCGNEIIIVATNLRQGKTQSCGCLQQERTSQTHRIDLTGQKIGKWFVLGLDNEKSQNGNLYWTCQCDCGTIKSVARWNLQSGASQSCGCETSRGERIISMLLSENNIFFVKEKTFDNLVSEEKGGLLRYDFWVNNTYLIEFDGIQHFQANEKGWNNESCLARNQKRDTLKNNYCFENNIPLIRIPYTHLSKLCLEDLLLETSQFIVKKQED